MLLHLVVVYLFLFPQNILLCDYATIYLSILVLMNIWIVSKFWLLWIMLLRKPFYMILVHIFHFTYLSGKSFYLQPWWIVSSTLVNNDIIFQIGCTNLHFHQQCKFTLPPAMVESFSCSVSLPIVGTVTTFNFSHSSKCIAVTWL